MAFKFKCENCRHDFEDENTLAYCPQCCEMCEYADTQEDEGGFIVEDEEGVAQLPEPPAVPQLKMLEESANFVLGDNENEIDDVYKPAVVSEAPTPPPVTTPPPRRSSQSPTPRPSARNTPNPPPISVALAPPLVARQSAMPSLLTIPPMAKSVSLKRKRSISPDLDPTKSIWTKIRSNSTVLLIGEGNFSFALALAKRIGTARGIVATDVEMHHELRDQSGCDATIMPLINMGACINCVTDVSQLSTSSPWKSRALSFDFMSWAFPHTRTPNKDLNSVPEHRWLLRAFIDEAAKMLKLGGVALITVKEGYPYNSWDVAGLHTDYMNYIKGEPFFPKDFPEYRHVTTVGAPIMQITPATTHVFRKVLDPILE